MTTRDRFFTMSGTEVFPHKMFDNGCVEWHPQVPTTVSGVSVDEKLIGLIEALWQHNMQTQFSCQDTNHDGKRAHIVFTNLDHAYRFIRESVVALGESLDFTDPSDMFTLQPGTPFHSTGWRGFAEFSGTAH